MRPSGESEEFTSSNSLQNIGANYRDPDASSLLPLTKLQPTNQRPPPHLVPSTTSHEPSTRVVVSLLLTTSLCTLVFTLVPVLIHFGSLRSDGWYVGNDVIRLLEPLVAMPLYLALLMSSGILAAAPNRRTYTVGVLFMFASGIYSQGAGFHSAAVMFKHPLKLFMDDQPGLVATYPFFSKYYAWQRTTWEHTIAHYLYALGGILISIVVGYAHRHTTDAKGMSSRIDRCMFVLAVVLYALIMGSVAIEFPKGSIVALCLIALGTSVMGTWVVRRDRRWRKAVTWGNRYVLQFYFAAYCGALVIVVAWIAHAGGFVDREDAGITF